MKCSTLMIPLLLACGACVTMPQSAVTSTPAARGPLFNGGLESWTLPNCPDKWACSQHTGKVSFRFAADTSERVEGQRSLSIERTGPEDWATFVQYINPTPLHGKSVRLSASIKRQGVGGGGAGLLLVSNVPVVGTATTANTYATGSIDWQREEIIFSVPHSASELRVGAALEGSGKVWIDDIKLEVVSDR